MTPFKHVNPVAAAVLLALATSAAGAAEEEAKPAPPPGLPSGIDWTFNLDATYGAFGFDNSLYLDPRPDEPSGDLGDNWTEGTLKAGLGGVFKNAGGSEWYGKLSAVGEGTYSDAPDLVGSDATSFGVEDAYIGWRSGTSIGGGENVLDFTVGRTQYKLGHGMLLYDGSSEVARAVVTGRMHARHSSSRPSAASIPATTSSKCSTSIAMNCRSPTVAASWSARTTSIRSTRTMCSAQPT
jgi:hypothetical protein